MEPSLKFNALQQRKIAAIVGAAIGDAAAQPMHWIYALDIMKALVEGVEEIEFRNPSANPFYRIATGKNSCYGDQAYVMLKSLVASKGLNIENLVEESYTMFGPESEYENTENSKYTVGKEDKINIKKTLPIYCPWRHGCIKDFLANLKEKKSPTGSENDDSIDGAVRVIPLVALYAGHPDLLMEVERGMSVIQCNETVTAAVLAWARVLEQYILHGDPTDVLQTVIGAINSRDNPNPQELDKAVAGQLRSVLRAMPTEHAAVVPTTFQNN